MAFDSFFNLSSLYLEYLKVDDRVNTEDSNTPSQSAKKGRTKGRGVQCKISPDRGDQPHMLHASRDSDVQDVSL
jgi:hypothetical protein